MNGPRHLIARLLLALGLSVIVAGVAVPPGARASHQGEGIPDETSVSLSFVASAHEQIRDRLAARLVTYDGTPIGRAEVEFRREIEFLGPRKVLLGRAITDATGVAQIPIAPTDDLLRVQVEFKGNERYAPASATVDLELPAGRAGSPRTGAFQPPRAGAGLGALASVMPPVIAIGALGVWIALAALTFITLLGIRRGRPQITPGREGGGIGSR